jgi:hypothetical protein
MRLALAAAIHAKVEDKLETICFQEEETGKKDGRAQIPERKEVHVSTE